MNPEDYVSYPLALALKKHGFDWPCRHHYDIEDAPEGCYWEGCSLHKKNHNEDIPKFSAPTLWQAQKWLREKKGIAVSVQASEIQGELWYSADIISTKGISELVNGGFDYINYESALSAGIAAALELIEKKGD